MGHITVSIREYAGDTRGFAEDSRGFAEDSQRIREQIRDGFATVRDGYAHSRIEFTRMFARVREDSRGFATNTRVREDSRGFATNTRIRKDSREVRDADGYASSRIEFARIREHSRPVNDSSPSLIRVGAWLGHPLRYGFIQLC